jgi:hypothetical protein
VTRKPGLRPAFRRAFAALTSRASKAAGNRGGDVREEADTGSYLGDTIQWLQAWEDNSPANTDLNNDSFTLSTDNYMPQP